MPAGIIDVLYEYIFKNKLSRFNSAIQTHGKYRNVIIKTKDDFSEINEASFIEIMRAGKIISKDIRKILDEKLGFRNTCAHPNPIKIKEPKVISFIDDLIENVVMKFL